MSEPLKSYRPIRSFVCRQGRLTRAQNRALNMLWPKYGIDADDNGLDLVRCFGRDAPVMLEIGFGDGKTLAQLAAAHPQNNYLGIEPYPPGVGSLLLRAESLRLENLRILQADAREVLESGLKDGVLDAVYLFFPDPWPKKRHHKRRLVQPRFVQLIRDRLKPGGVFHVATDWEDYAQHILAVLSAAEGLENAAGVGAYSKRPGYRSETKFEQRGKQLGHNVRDLIFHRSQYPD